MWSGSNFEPCLLYRINWSQRDLLSQFQLLNYPVERLTASRNMLVDLMLHTTLVFPQVFLELHPPTSDLHHDRAILELTVAPIRTNEVQSISNIGYWYINIVVMEYLCDVVVKLVSSSWSKCCVCWFEISFLALLSFSRNH